MNLPIHLYGSGEALVQRHSQALATGMSSTVSCRPVHSSTWALAATPENTAWRCERIQKRDGLLEEAWQ